MFNCLLENAFSSILYTVLAQTLLVRQTTMRSFKSYLMLLLLLFRGPEVSILDYQTQQEKLLPGLATAYAFNAVGKRLQQVFNKVQADISKEHFSSLPEVSPP